MGNSEMRELAPVWMSMRIHQVRSAVSLPDGGGTISLAVVRLYSARAEIAASGRAWVVRDFE